MFSDRMDVEKSQMFNLPIHKLCVLKIVLPHPAIPSAAITQDNADNVFYFTPGTHCFSYFSHEILVMILAGFP